MSPIARKLTAVLLTALSLAIAAGAAWLFYTAASDYALSFAAVKFYCILWFAAAVLSVVAGVCTASPIALTAAALGFASFATICILNPDAIGAMPRLVLAVELAAPAFFIAAWFVITAVAFCTPAPAARRWGWVWLTIGLTVLFSFASYNYGRFCLSRLRSQDLHIAAANTLRIAEQLALWQQAHGVYPAALEQAGIDPALLQLPYRDQQIKYFGGRAMYILTFEDPLQSGSVVYSWDTSKGGWYPADPREAVEPVCRSLFLGALNPK